MKVAELEGAKLDWWVARARGHFANFKPVATPYAEIGPFPAYSTDWSEGGPIIERELISVYYDTFPTLASKWVAMKNADQTYDGLVGDHVMDGETILMAAMRCFVASKFGEEVVTE